MVQASLHECTPSQDVSNLSIRLQTALPPLPQLSTSIVDELEIMGKHVFVAPELGLSSETSLLELPSDYGGENVQSLPSRSQRFQVEEEISIRTGQKVYLYPRVLHRVVVWTDRDLPRVQKAINDYVCRNITLPYVDTGVTLVRPSAPVQDQCTVHTSLSLRPRDVIHSIGLALRKDSFPVEAHLELPEKFSSHPTQDRYMITARHPATEMPLGSFVYCPPCWQGPLVVSACILDPKRDLLEYSCSNPRSPWSNVTLLYPSYKIQYPCHKTPRGELLRIPREQTAQTGGGLGGEDKFNKRNDDGNWMIERPSTSSLLPSHGSGTTEARTSVSFDHA